ncbi:glycosyltransferase [Synechococcus sp. GFB01]|uniref:glycosyltransferase n=1 Tax=Synechococcus sp. GFB01 TaxID=1662190 RepID=UPI00069DD664|nr:glycosyltransferase [Synechococcus sp. GFB01]
MTTHSILHLSHSAGALDGGIATAVEALIAAQRAAGGQPEWLVADRWPAWRRDRALAAAIRQSRPDLVHIHGLWRSPTRLARQLSRRTLPYVIAPHGMLDPWALTRSRWRKRLVLELWERRALESAACLQALCAAEAEAIRALGLRAPLAVIPNGVDLPGPVDGLPPPPWQEQVPAGERVLLFLGRFHAKKGTAPLLQAWRRLSAEAHRLGWWLVLVGYGDDGALARQVAAAAIERALVLDPCFGAGKAACLAAASAFVLPSFSEGLPMAALEAMSWGLPCLLSPACNLPEAFAAGAAWPVEPSPAALGAALHELFTLPQQEATAMGQAGRALVARSYAWPTVAEHTQALYRWILGSGPEPPNLIHHRS